MKGTHFTVKLLMVLFAVCFCFGAMAEGASEDIVFTSTPGGESSFYAPVHSRYTMAADFPAELGEVVSYEWVQHVRTYYDDGGYDTEPVVLDGVTGNSFTVDDANERTVYYCQAVFADGSTAEVYFNIFINNNLNANSVGNSEYYCSYGSTRNLAVTAGCQDGTINYQWYRQFRDENDSWETIAIEGATQASVTTDSVTDKTYYYCRVMDDYHNTQDVWFNLYVQNHLIAYADPGHQTQDASIGLGSADESATMTVYPTADNSEGFTYTWYWYELITEENGYTYETMHEIQDADTDTYTGEIVRQNGYDYACTVTDCYGNRSTAVFDLYTENHLKVWPDGCSENDAEIHKDVSINEPLVLKANVSADDLSGVAYQWRKRQYDTSVFSWTPWETVEMNGDTYSISAVDYRSSYECTVTDKYGKSKSIYFYVFINNDLSAESPGGYERYVGLNERATLEVNGSCRNGDLSYAWYGDGYDDYGNRQWMCLGHGNTFITQEITAAQSYTCIVYDQYGNDMYIGFNIYPENHFKVWADDGSENENQSLTICEAPGSEVEMKVRVSADDLSGITYRWHWEKYDQYGNWGGGEYVDGAEQNCYTVQLNENITYYCRVQDRYGSYKYVYFYLYPENHLTAYVDGPDYNTQDWSTSLSPGDPVTMKVRVSADDMSGIQYEWRYQEYDYLTGSWTGLQKITGAAGDTYTLDRFEKPVTYVCYVWDQYGNRETVYFYMRVENNLRAYVDGIEYDTTSYTMYVSPREDVPLKVRVSADDMSGITYRWHFEEYNAETNEWSQWQEVDGTDSDSYVIENLTQYTIVYCEVRDQYENYTNVWFYVHPENHLTAYAVGPDYDTSGYDMNLPIGTAVNMAVRVSADDMSGITYEWRYNEYDVAANSWSEERIVDGATGNSYTLENFNKPANYYCYVRDSYGNRASVGFYLHIENHLTAYVDGPEDDITGYDISASPHETVNMKVRVSADDMTGITYKWYYHEYDYSTGEWSEWESADESVTNSYSRVITAKYAECYCEVRDQFGTYKNVWFYLHLDNHLTACVDGLDYDTSSYDYSVSPGDSLTLKTRVSADDMSAITYEWRYHEYDPITGNWTDEQVIEGATGNTYILASVNKRAEYWCNVEDQYSGSTSVRFYVQPENHLTAYVDGLDYDTTHYDYYVSPGDPLTLKLRVSADDMSGITYEWWHSEYNSGDNTWPEGQIIEGATGNSYVLGSVDKRAGYWCYVRDQYGNSTSVSFGVYVDNQFSAYVDGLDYDTTGYDYYIIPGNSINMKVRVSAANQNGITYEWRYSEYDYTTSVWTEAQVISGANGDSYTLESFTKRANYWCIVRDQYGNRAEVWFYLYVDNELVASAERSGYVLSESAAVTLNVIASCRDGNLRYEWFRIVDGSWNWIEEADGASYTTDVISGAAEFYCNVYDQYGNVKGASFIINVIPGVQELSLGTETTANITNQWQYFRFIPEDTLAYAFYSMSNEDTYCCLYDSRMNQLFSTDYGGEGYNFRMDYILEAGEEYIFAVSFNDGRESGSFPVRLTIENYLEAYVDGVDYNQTEYYCTYGAPSTWVEMRVRVTANDMSGITYQWYSFTNDAFGNRQDTVLIEGANTYSYMIDLLDRSESYYCLVSDQYGSSRKVYFYHYLDNGLSVGVNQDVFTVFEQASVTMKVSAYCNNGELSYQWYQFANENYYLIDGATEPAYTVQNNTTAAYYCVVSDQYGNMFNVRFDINVVSGVRVLDLNAETTADITHQMLYYSFTPQNTGEYTIYSMSNEDTYVHLYDADLNQLDYDDDGGENTNFSLTYTLEAGTEYIYGVRFYNRRESGSFPLKLIRNGDLSFENVLNLPSGLITIESEAFAGLTNVDAVRIPGSVESIADDAFSGSNVVIIAPAESKAAEWAEAHGFECVTEEAETTANQ